MARPAAIRPASEITDWVRLMVVAPSGWGKTPFAGTADQRATGGNKALFLSVDPEGVTSAFTSGSTADVWQIKSWDELENALRWFQSGEGTDEYQVLIIDSLNEVQNLNKDHILRLPTRGKSDPDVLAQPDYQRNQIHMIQMVKKFNELPIHIVWNVQTKKEDDETDLGFRYEPLIQGQQGDLSQQIKGYMKIIAYGTFVQKKKAGTADETVEVPRLIFRHKPPFMGRDRTGALPEYLDRPTVPQILDAVAAKMAAVRAAASGTAPRGPRKAAPAARKAAPVKKAGARTARSA